MIAPGSWIEWSPNPELRLAVFAFDAQRPYASTRTEICEAPKKETDRVRFLARRLMVRRILAQWLNRSMESLDLRRDPRTGAAMLRDAASRNANWFVSLAGRDNFGGLALANRPVGFDLEVLSEFTAAPAWNVLHPREAARLKTVSIVNERAQNFIKIWTAKEAYLKLLKTGLNREPCEIEIEVDDDRFGVWDANQRARLDSTGWRTIQDEQRMIYIAWALGFPNKNSGSHLLTRLVFSRAKRHFPHTSPLS